MGRPSSPTLAAAGRQGGRRRRLRRLPGRRDVLPRHETTPGAPPSPRRRARSSTKPRTRRSPTSPSTDIDTDAPERVICSGDPAADARRRPPSSSTLPATASPIRASSSPSSRPGRTSAFRRRRSRARPPPVSDSNGLDTSASGPRSPTTARSPRSRRPTAARRRATATPSSFSSIAAPVAALGHVFRRDAHDLGPAPPVRQALDDSRRALVQRRRRPRAASTRSSRTSSTTASRSAAAARATARRARRRARRWRCSF